MGALRARFAFRARRRDLDRGRPAQGRRGDHRLPRRVGLQPHLGRHPGFRPRGPGGGQPHPERGRNARRDRRRARQRVHVGQCGPDLRLAAADGGGIRGDARQGDRRLAGPHRALQLRARAASFQVAASDRDRRVAVTGRQARASSRWPSTSSARPATATSAWTISPSPATNSPWRSGERKLHRNFQGYSTRPDCDLLAFGISAIGKVGPTYVQNVKTLDAYYRAPRRPACCRCCAARR